MPPSMLVGSKSQSVSPAEEAWDPNLGSLDLELQHTARDGDTCGWRVALSGRPAAGTRLRGTRLTDDGRCVRADCMLTP